MSQVMSLAILLAATTFLGQARLQLAKPEIEARYISGGHAAYTATITAIGALAKPVREGARPRRPVTLRVDEILTGSHVKPGEIVVRDYVEPSKPGETWLRPPAPALDLDAASRGEVREYSIPPRPEYSVAWESVTPRVGAKLLIFDVGEAIGAAEADASPVAAKLRRLIQLHERARRDPNVLANHAENLKPNADRIETFYVIDAVPARLPPDMAADTLMALIEKNGFTPAQYGKLHGSFTLVWFQCTERVKARTLKRLAHVAASADYERARPAVNHLLMMRSSGIELPQLEPDVARQLRANYERFVVSGYTRDPALEASLKRMAGFR